MYKYNYQEGDIIGVLTFVNRLENNANGRQMANFRCECGKEFITRIDSVKLCRVKSCGCKTSEMRSKSLTTHGHSPASGKSSEYTSWEAMWRRVTDPTHRNNARYAELGVTITDDWQTFDEFIKDMGVKPKPSYTIERVDNHKGYYKENCIWGTRSIQARNKDNTTFCEYKGVKKSIAEWAEIIGFNLSTLYGRIVQGKWDIERAFTQPSKGVYPKTVNINNL